MLDQTKTKVDQTHAQITDALTQVKNIQTQLDLDVYPILGQRSNALKSLNDKIAELLAKFDALGQKVDSKFAHFTQYTDR